MAVMVAEAVTPGQARVFARRQERARNRLFRQEAAAVKRMRRLVSDLRRAITLEMAQTQSAFRLTGLARLQANLDAAIARFAVDAAGDLAERQRLAWDLGVGSVDDALRAVGMLPVLPAVGMEQLAVLSQYGTDLIGGLSQHARARVRPVLTQAAAGVISLRDAMQRIGGGIDRGAFKTVAARAEAIVRTEVLRSYSIAQDRRLRDAAGAGVPLRRRWVAVLDGRTRPAHRAAHGQVRPFNRWFNVGGEKLRYPRDPRAGAANTIQCRCVVIPVLVGKVIP